MVSNTLNALDNIWRPLSSRLHTPRHIMVACTRYQIICYGIRHTQRSWKDLTSIFILGNHSRGISWLFLRDIKVMASSTLNALDNTWRPFSSRLLTPEGHPITQQRGRDIACFPEKKQPFPLHDDVIKWNHFPRYWQFVRGIHRSPHKGQWRGALMFF